MHIGIDARMAGIHGGHGRYLRHLIARLAVFQQPKNTPPIVYTLFVLESDRELFNKLPSHRFKIVVADIPWYSIREQFTFPKIIKAAHVDLMHFPHWNVPLKYRGPFVTTIHDLTLRRFPGRDTSLLGFFGYYLKKIGYRIVLHRAIFGSRHIIVPSHYVAHEIHHWYPSAATPISVIYEGAPACNATNTPAKANPYLLYVGVAYPHKNLLRLVRAFMQYKDSKPMDPIQLILVGQHSRFYEQLEEQIAARFPRALGHTVEIRKKVTDKELQRLYQGARGMVYVSLSEGFGLPPLEALAHGIPVLVSNTSCLPEIVGDAALYADPTSTDSIAQGIDTLVNNTAAREKALAAAPTMLAKYSWERMALETVTMVYLPR
jgi:glycosyltransferase involved in cell wall biosynthesis